jgi:hypothetical protein
MENVMFWEPPGAGMIENVMLLEPPSAGMMNKIVFWEPPGAGMMENVIFSSSQLQKNIRKYNKTDRWPPAPCGSPPARNVLFINFDAAKRGTNGKVLFLEPPGAGMMEKRLFLEPPGARMMENVLFWEPPGAGIMENVLFLNSQLQTNKKYINRKYDKTYRWPPAPCGIHRARSICSSMLRDL